MKCDMHVHTIHSGMCTVPVVRALCKESYSEPEALYEKLKRKGMNLVTVTDHDSIGALESLRRRPDFFLSEEVTCRLESGSELHVGVYDITDRDHIEMQRRRDDFEAFHAYLIEQKLLFSANHIYSRLTGRRDASDFECFESRFPAVETLNGCMLRASNLGARSFASSRGKIGIGGSDAHTIRSAGSCWTEVPGARTKAEFFAGLKQRSALTHGSSGSYWRLTRDVVTIGLEMVRSNPFTAPALPLAVLVPVITLVNYIIETSFSRIWIRRTARSEEAGTVGREVLDKVAA